MKVDVYNSVCQTVGHTLSVGCEIVLVRVTSIFIKGRKVQSECHIIKVERCFLFF